MRAKLAYMTAKGGGGAGQSGNWTRSTDGAQQHNAGRHNLMVTRAAPGLIGKPVLTLIPMHSSRLNHQRFTTPYPET